MFDYMDRNYRVKTLGRKLHRLQRSHDYFEPFAPGKFQFHTIQINACCYNLLVPFRSVQQMSLAAADLQQPDLFAGREVSFDFRKYVTIF